MIRDIHARKQAEADLRQLNETLERRVAERTAELQEANEDLRTFSYTLSHDLRAPLRSIGRFGEEIVQGVSEADNRSLAQENARRIVAATARLDRLILDLYEYNQLARTEARSRRISLILVVNEIVGQIKREPEFANVEFNIREPMPWVLAHRPTLAMVLHNLLSNAVKFVTPPTQPVVTISATVVKEQARLTVEDNGKGIEQTRAQSLFALLDQPADDVESSGEGIGLAIVRRGVERMGGCVGVESTPGVGSRFWIELPLDPQSP
jgi:signal transduction histidine kinase